MEHIRDYQIHVETSEDTNIVTILFETTQVRNLIPESFKSSLPDSLFTDLSLLVFNSPDVKQKFVKFVFDTVLKLYPDLYMRSFEYDGGSTIIIHL